MTCRGCRGNVSIPRSEWEHAQVELRRLARELADARARLADSTELARSLRLEVERLRSLTFTPGGPTR